MAQLLGSEGTISSYRPTEFRDFPRTIRNLYGSPGSKEAWLDLLDNIAGIMNPEKSLTGVGGSLATTPISMLAKRAAVKPVGKTAELISQISEGTFEKWFKTLDGMITIDTIETPAKGLHNVLWLDDIGKPGNRLSPIFEKRVDLLNWLKSNFGRTRDELKKIAESEVRSLPSPLKGE